MSSIRRILTATDLSTPARHAVYRAAWLAREHQAELTVQHVIDQGAMALFDSIVESMNRRQLDDIVQNAHQQVDKLLAAVQSTYGIAAQRRLDTGRVVRAIMGAIADTDPDLIVLGARGLGFVRHALLGSTPERLLARSRKPLLVVRHSPRDTYHRPLVAVDFSSRSLPALQLAHDLAPDAQITALHVHQIPFEERLRGAGLAAETVHDLRRKVETRARTDMDALLEQCRAAGLPVTGILETGEPSHRILEHEHEQDCDLIVLGRHAQDPLSELAVGSVARHVLNHAHGDVLMAGQVD